jgi:hypothetical protein
MTTISELVGRSISPPDFARRAEAEFLMAGPIDAGNRTARHSTYEIEVLNFLHGNRAALGIQSTTRFRNRLVDGQIVLSDGWRFVVEIKLRMNWLKACQSEWQFRHFLKRFDSGGEASPVRGAIVFFEEFSGDWAKPRAKRKNVLGWEAWYLYYRDAIDGKPMDLVRLHDGKLEGYPDTGP